MFSIWQYFLIRRADKLLANIDRAEALALTLIPIPYAKDAHKRCINHFQPLVTELRQNLCDRKVSSLNAYRCLRKVNAGLRETINYLKDDAKRNKDGKLRETFLRYEAEGREQRDAVIRGAKSACLLDAVFQIVMHNKRKWEYKIDIHEAGLPFAQTEIDAAVERAYTLIDEACGLVGAYWPGCSADYHTAELAFYQRNPGFSDESYRAAISYGCFVMR